MRGRGRGGGTGGRGGLGGREGLAGDGGAGIGGESGRRDGSLLIEVPRRRVVPPEFEPALRITESLLDHCEYRWIVVVLGAQLLEPLDPAADRAGIGERVDRRVER